MAASGGLFIFEGVNPSMKIIPKLKVNKRLYMLMTNKDLPPHGKAFVWVLVAGVGGIFASVCLLILSWAGVVQ